MGKEYLIDSNAVIDYLMGRLPVAGMEFMNRVVNDIPKVSVITKIEVLGFETISQEYVILQQFFNDSVIYQLSEEIVEQTINLRKNHKIKLPDAIIAATALTFEFELITRNTSDFNGLPRISCINPYQL